MLVTQVCPTPCNPKDCNPPDISVHGFLQARVLEWIAIPSSRGSSQARDWAQFCRQILYHPGHQRSTPPPSKKKKEHMVSFWLLAFHTGVECILTSAVIGRAVVMERKQTSMSLTVSAVSHVFSPLAVLLVVFCVSLNTQRPHLPVNSSFVHCSQRLQGPSVYLFWVKCCSS